MCDYLLVSPRALRSTIRGFFVVISIKNLLPTQTSLMKIELMHLQFICFEGFTVKSIRKIISSTKLKGRNLHSSQYLRRKVEN
jgi:hypothetical protein